MQDVCFLCWFPWYVLLFLCMANANLCVYLLYAHVVMSFGAETVAVRTVNRQCSSGLQAVADVAAAIKAGFYDIG